MPRVGYIFNHHETMKTTRKNNADNFPSLSMYFYGNYYTRT